MTTLTVLAIISIALIALVLLVDSLAMAILFIVLRRLLQRVRTFVGPAMAKTNDIMLTVNRVAEKVNGKTTQYSGKAAQVADTTLNTVDRVSLRAERAVTAPFVALAAFSAGWRSGMAAWHARRRERQLLARTVGQVPHPSVVEVEGTPLLPGEERVLRPEDTAQQRRAA